MYSAVTQQTLLDDIDRRHRAEALNYIPPRTTEDYRREYEAGDDSYSSIWFDAALAAFVIALAAWGLAAQVVS